MIGYRNKWDDLEEFSHIGIGLKDSLQSSMDMFNQTIGGSLSEKREGFHQLSQINRLDNLAITSTGSFSDRAKEAISQVNMNIDTLGLGETFTNEATRKAMLGVESLMIPEYMKSIESEKLFHEGIASSYAKEQAEQFMNLNQVCSIDSFTREAIEQVNPYMSSALGFSETLAHQVTRDSLMGIESVSIPNHMELLNAEKLIAQGVVTDYTMEGLERLKGINQISFGEELNLHSIMDYAKELREHDTFKIMEKLAIEVAMPIKSYAEQMQIALREPLQSIREEMMSGFGTVKEFSKIHSEFSDLYKPQIEIASESIRSLQESLNGVWNEPSIQDMSTFLSTTVDSYRSIHNVLDHKSIANMFPDNMDLLIQGLIDVEPLTQEYLRTIHDRPIALAVEEPNVLVEIEAIKNEVLESIHEGNQQLNQAIEKLYAFVVAQKDPKVILFLQQYLLPIILSIIASFIFKYMDSPKEPFLKTKNQEVFLKKQVQIGLKKYIPNPKDRIHYRIVNVDRLNIRDGRSRKTEVISHLNFSDVVQIVKKEKNWTLIKKYNEEQETVIQGWVFTRYLTPIK